MLIPLPYLAAITGFVPSIAMTAAAVVVSFVVITLVSSYFRFQRIVDMAENIQPEEMGSSREDILRIQLARFLAASARKNTSFVMGLIRSDNPDLTIRMGSPFIDFIKASAREEDVVCVYDDQTVVLLAEAEAEDGVSVLSRITKLAGGVFGELETCPLRAGVSAYPSHGLSGKELLAAALRGLDETQPEHPVMMPEIVDYNEEEDDAEEDSSDHVATPDAEEEARKAPRRKRKDRMIDEVTGVLKPQHVSAYMQRLLSDLRRKKHPASLFCVGVNNMEHIARFHGEQAAVDVLVGVSEILQKHLRADDLIGRHEEHAFLILTTATLAQSEIIGKRLSTLVQQTELKTGGKRLKTTLSVAVASYPEHGRNLHQMYSAAQRVLDYNRENDIRAYAVYNPAIHDTMPSKPMRSIKATKA